MTKRSAGAYLAFHVALVSVLVAGAHDRPLSGSFTNWIDHPAIGYVTTPTTDPVGALMRRIDAGLVALTGAGESDHLRALLKELDVPIESQIAVFNKDSLQALRIDRNNPRTIFFNDAVAVGWVRGGVIELASQDPSQGAVFYTVDRSSQAGASRIVRRTECLRCHYSYDTVGVPGMLARSVGQTAADHRLPFTKRWGGWYVTGKHGVLRHMGNADIAALPDAQLERGSLNWASLDGKVNMSQYPSAHSDIVALMVFEHQMHGMNLLSRLGWEARVASYTEEHTELPSSDGDAPIPLSEAAREVVDYLLFVDEAQLPGPIRGSTAFAERFASQGPRDRRSRSLRQLDLETRLFRYQCSYLIYTDQFTHLPRPARDAIFERMWRVLSGQDRDPRYTRLTLDDRRAIVEILRDTKRDLPSYFLPGGLRP